MIQFDNINHLQVLLCRRLNQMLNCGLSYKKYLPGLTLVLCHQTERCHLFHTGSELHAYRISL